jgi:GT2 family glycosyltransferase
MEKKLAIVIPVYNNWTFTKNTMQYLDCLPNNHKIIIVDNFSTDNTKELISNEKFEIIKNKSNLFFAKACNQGYCEAKKLGYENVMFLNNDIKVTDNFNNWTEKLIESAENGNIVGPTVGCLADDLSFICETNKFPTKGIWYMSGWNITASISTWDKLIIDGNDGPISTEFNFYFEDADLGIRAQKLNIPSEIVSIPVKHYGKATAKNIGVSSLYQSAREIFLKKWQGKL